MPQLIVVNKISVDFTLRPLIRLIIAYAFGLAKVYSFAYTENSALLSFCRFIINCHGIASTRRPTNEIAFIHIFIRRDVCHACFSAHQITLINYCIIDNFVCIFYCHRHHSLRRYTITSEMKAKCDASGSLTRQKMVKFFSQACLIQPAISTFM